MALTYTQLTAITEKLYLKKLVDNIYGTNALIARFTQPNKLQLKTGGERIMVPVINSKPSIGGFYSDLDALSTNASDNLTAAYFEWKQLFEPIRVARSDILKNAGDAQKLSLIESKVKIAEYNIKENLGLGLFSDGTAGTGAASAKQITGLGALMSTSSTYGGIAVADMASWVAIVKENSSVDRALSLNLMQQAMGSATQAESKPSVAVMRQNVFDQCWALFQPHQRLMSESMAKLGFENVLTFNGIPLLVDSHADAKSIYFIDESNVFLAVMKDENLRKETIERLETSNSMLMRIFWMGNLCCASRRTNAILQDIEVAA